MFIPECVLYKAFTSGPFDPCMVLKALTSIMNGHFLVLTANNFK